MQHLAFNLDAYTVIEQVKEAVGKSKKVIVSPDKITDPPVTIVTTINCLNMTHFMSLTMCGSPVVSLPNADVSEYVSPGKNYSKLKMLCNVWCDNELWQAFWKSFCK